MHPNEVDFRIPVIGGENALVEHAVKLATYHAQAEKLGPKYVEALKIQMLRQS